ncbi:hypothetical protein Dimus_034519 [Dionaea muscipula]
MTPTGLPPSDDGYAMDSYVLETMALITAVMSIFILVAVAGTTSSSEQEQGPQEAGPAIVPYALLLRRVRHLSGGFVAGDEIRMLPQCGRGFHVVCIDTWLVSHSSCPSSPAAESLSLLHSATAAVPRRQRKELFFSISYLELEAG